MFTLRLSFGLALSPLLLIACSGETPSSPDASSSVDATPPFDGPGDSPVTDAGVVEAAAEAEASAPIQGGEITLTRLARLGWNTPYISDYSAFARFYTPYPYATDVCTRTTVGACETSQCVAKADAGAQITYGAGTITISGGNPQLQLPPPYTASAPTVLWSGGETIHAVATGNDVPAFDMKLIAPAQITVVKPPAPVSQNTKIAFDRTQDYVVNWVAGTFGDVVVQFDSLTSSPYHHVVCKYPAASGTGTIPAAAIASLPTSGLVAFSVESVSSSYQEVGGWGLTFSAHFNAVFSDSRQAYAQASIP